MPKIRKSSCPECGYEMDGATHCSDVEAMPDKGDISVCIECAAFLQFGDDLILEPMPESVWDDIHPESASQLLQIRKQILSRGKLH